MPIYLKLGSLKGSSTATFFEQWMELKTWQWGNKPTTSSEREVTNGTPPSIVCTRDPDGLSPVLMQLAGRPPGQPGEGWTATLAATKNGDGRPQEVMRLEMRGVLVASYLGSNGGRGAETFTLNFAKYTLKYKLPGDPDENQTIPGDSFGTPAGNLAF